MGHHFIASHKHCMSLHVDLLGIKIASCYVRNRETFKTNRKGA